MASYSQLATATDGQPGLGLNKCRLSLTVLPRPVRSNTPAPARGVRHSGARPRGPTELMISSRVGSRQCKSVWKRPHASSSSDTLAGPTLPSIYKQVPPERKTAVSATFAELVGGERGPAPVAREWVVGA